MLIREATAEDWPRIWAFMAGVVAAGRTYTYPEDMTSDEGRAAWMLSAPWVVQVAQEDDTILGTAKYGPNLPGRGAHVANASFVVDPSATGRGIGRVLAERVIADARAAERHPRKLSASCLNLRYLLEIRATRGEFAEGERGRWARGWVVG